MAKGKTARLRIFCICGQKMKVSPSMYGRPGKCVACRQKIRIPTAEEIPAETHEIHLKDHPEFLRKPSAAANASAGAPPEPEPVELGQEDRQEPTAAIEVLEPLRVLCSLETKADRQLKALADLGKSGAENKERRAELEGHKTRIRRARNELDETLRQYLMETAIELASVQQKLADIQLSARVGELTFQEYRESAERSRRRRDHLEQLQHDLRGWLGVRDASAAGGYVDASFDNVPEDVEINLPDRDSDRSLIEDHVAALRSALERRERTERKLSEANRLKPADGEPANQLKELRDGYRCDVRRAQAAVAFHMGRLDQLRADYESDLQTVEAQLDLARGRLQMGDIDRGKYDTLEASLTAAKADLNKAVALAKRALSAPSAADLPQAHGTYLQRLATPNRKKRITSDSWLAWMAAIVFVASLALPVLDGLVPSQVIERTFRTSPMTAGLVAAPVLLALAAFVTGFLLPRSVRTAALGVVSLVAVLFLTSYSLAVAQGQPYLNVTPGGAGYTQPGAILWLAALVLLALATGISAVSQGTRSLSAVVSVVVLVVFASLILLLTTLRRAEWLDMRSAASAATAGDAATAIPEPADISVPPPSPATEIEVPVSEAEVPDVVVTPPTEPPPVVQPSDPLGVRTVEAELKMVLSSPEREPQFLITLHVPGETPYDRSVKVGEVVYREWNLAEYNLAGRSVTLTKNDKPLILRQGERVALEILH